MEQFTPGRGIITLEDGRRVYFRLSLSPDGEDLIIRSCRTSEIKDDLVIKDIHPEITLF